MFRNITRDVACASAPLLGFRSSGLPPDALYQDAYRRLVQVVCTAVGREVRMEHVGSTSVPGLGGRGVIDAAIIESDSAQRASLTGDLLRSALRRAPFGWMDPTLTGEVTVGQRDFPVLVYLLGPEDPVLQGWLTCRDYWRSDPQEASRYAEVKRQAIAGGNTMPWQYQQAKGPYLEQLALQLGAESR